MVRGFRMGIASVVEVVPVGPDVAGLEAVNFCEGGEVELKNVEEDSHGFCLCRNNCFSS